MKNNKNISRRDFLLVKYIKEALNNQSRRTFLKLGGGAAAAATLGFGSNKAQAKSSNNIINEIINIIISNSNLIVKGKVDNTIGPFIFVKFTDRSGQSFKFEFNLSKIKAKNTSQIKIIAKNIDFDDSDYVIDNLNKFKKEIEKSQVPEIEEIYLDDEENISKKRRVDPAEQFKNKCLEVLKKYKKSYKIECVLLYTILKNSNFYAPENKNYISFST